MMLNSQNTPACVSEDSICNHIVALKKSGSVVDHLIFYGETKMLLYPNDDRALPDERGLKFIRILIKKRLRHIN